ncbi:HAD family hydrolase [Natrarchaeobaculum aegyptiacum]|uniref:Haloacid dehalogenase n=1 Tax=Natrarchaeobaculum aegyptiacum TaxID=745377 RepID=A0A2Z2I1G8_9EURY|nr:HAD family hydrolase [Natrarchaeobaculum aegyptiacum]ARS90308.1 haloacid dehalogenase [Natrarchaeobaculum aegyptiacum]
MAAYDAVCFDLDRTLCEPTQDPETVLESAFDSAGYDPFCTHDDLRALVPSVPSADSDREFYVTLFETVLERSDGEPETDRPATDVATTLADSYLETADPTAVQFRPGAERVLEYARDRARVGLITNGERPRQVQKLESLGIADAFDVRVYTDPGAGIDPKPSTTPFEYALGKLAAKPAASIHVGDSLHADIAGANAMGLDSAWLADGTERPGDHRPTYELRSLEALEEIV